jgi:hypothetical protein
MALTQLHSIFDAIKQMHHQAAVCCAAGAHSPDTRLNLLADFFRHCEEQLEDYVASLESGEQQAILNTWVRFAPTAGIDNALSSLHRSRCRDTGVFVDRCFELQEEIVSVLEELANDVELPKARQLLLDAAKFEQQAAKLLGSAELTEYDA